MDIKADYSHYWANLIQSNKTQLDAFLKKRLNNAEDVADLLQDVFVQLSKVSPRSLVSPKAYLFRSAANLAINYAKREAVFHQKKLHVTAQHVDWLRADSLELELAEERQRQQLIAALEQLPENCRSAFILHRFYPDSYSDIALKLNVSVSMVEKYVAQALGHCRRYLEQHSG